jgi:transketolase
MLSTPIVPIEEFLRVRQAQIDTHAQLSLIADMCRLNTLSAVKRAGSGHLGSSFSAMEIVVWLYYHEMNTLSVGLGDPNRDIYFSSKGHDVPGLYSVLYSLGVIPEEKLLRLRRLGGLDGHPDVGIPGIEANSGSLGMGISKGKGMAWAKQYRGHSGRVFVMTGDGELQEGQSLEAMQSAAQQRVGRLIVIVDHNKVQSDKRVSEIVDLRDLERRFEGFGWYVARCNGHDLSQIESAFSTFGQVQDRPKALIADTIKGSGVSFMEHPYALEAHSGLYPWHSGAPDDRSFMHAHQEIVERTNGQLASLGLAALTLKTVEGEGSVPSTPRPSGELIGEPISQAAVGSTERSVSDEYVADAYGEALVRIASDRQDLVVLDGDLASDCRVRMFEAAYPERFIENGIAEQDMVSMAGGLARSGLLPVVNSFASFLAARGNEQIYNNASEKTKVIYAFHYAGLIPAGPGKSHQSIRDISLLAALPNCTIIQPCNAIETRMAVEYAVHEAQDNIVLRLIIGPSPRAIQLPEGYRLTPGRGVILADGSDAVLFAYGPVMLHEALRASELLRDRGFGLRVVNMPWLNRVDVNWVDKLSRPFDHRYVLEDHASVGGLGDCLRRNLQGTEQGTQGVLGVFGIEGYPACGRPGEVLAFHRLDGASLAEQVLRKADAADPNSAGL